MLVNWSRIVSKACGGPCSCDATPGADTDMPVSSEASGEWVSVYAVPKMDCPSEERMIRLALNLIRIYAILSAPFIPDAAASMMTALNSRDWTWPSDVHAAIRALPAGHEFAVPENLFRKITDEERAEWQVKFAGVRT